MAKRTRKGAKDYGADSIDVVEGIEHVRLRPNMYLADTGKIGVVQLVKEVLDNSLDEWLAGHVTKIKVALHDPLTFSVADNGRGIPVSKHKDTGESVMTSIFTVLGAGGKFRDEAYGGVSVGLHGVGLTVVNAVTTRCEVWSKRKGKTWYQQFKQTVKDGKSLKVWSALKKSKKELRKGTTIKAAVDPEIFGKARLDENSLALMLGAISHLCPGLEIQFKGPTISKKWNSQVGIEGILTRTWGEDMDIGPILIETEDVDVCVAWKFKEQEGESWKSYVNVSPTPDGGTHVSGAQYGVSTALQSWSKGKGLSGKDLRDGLVGVVHVLIPSPQFGGGQAKLKLSGDEVKILVREVAHQGLLKWFKKNRKTAKELVERSLQFKEKKAEYRKARATLRKVTKTTRGSLPPKLAASPRCPPARRELMIVEGDSAGGSAVSARDPKYQEVLPIRGKMINAERATLKQLLDNTEIQSILRSVGGGFGPDFRESDMRVGKVLLLMDADADGLHIVCLMLAFFLKYLKGVIKSGRLYVIESPLYVAKLGEKRWFGDSREDIVKKAGPKANLTRLKGHGGSRVSDIKYYAMGPHRKLTRVSPKQAERALELMGPNVAARKELLFKGVKLG